MVTPKEDRDITCPSYHKATDAHSVEVSIAKIIDISVKKFTPLIHDQANNPDSFAYNASFAFILLIMPLIITSSERSALRSQAHALHPVVIVSNAGLTDAVLKEIDSSLNAHGLIKVRVFQDDREVRTQFYETICNQLNAAPIQHIGKLLVLYRPKPDALPQPLRAKRGKGMSEVTIIKPSKTGTKRPSITKVLLKGNERVTVGGHIKRAKPRQASAKKKALG